MAQRISRAKQSIKASGVPFSMPEATERTGRAHLFQMAGDNPSAIAHYRAAARRTMSIPERDYLTMQAARLAS